MTEHPDIGSHFDRLVGQLREEVKTLVQATEAAIARFDQIGRLIQRLGALEERVAVLEDEQNLARRFDSKGPPS